MTTLAQALREHWRSIGIGTNPSAASTAIEAFESKYDVRLTRELRIYFSTLDGMPEGEIDEDVFWFLPLHAVKPVSEELVEYGGIPDYRPLRELLPDAGQWFIVVDYMMCSHVYAVRLTNVATEASPVLWISGSEHQQITDTFAEFLSLYLDNPRSILFPCWKPIKLTDQ